LLSPPKLLMMMSSAAGVKGQSDPLTGPRSKVFCKKKNQLQKIHSILRQVDTGT
jgi:hypothetical protein